MESACFQSFKLEKDKIVKTVEWKMLSSNAENGKTHDRVIFYLQILF